MFALHSYATWTRGTYSVLLCSGTIVAHMCGVAIVRPSGSGIYSRLTVILHSCWQSSRPQPAASGLMGAAHNAAQQRQLRLSKERMERMARRTVDTIDIDVNDENRNRLTLPLTPNVPLSEADYGGETSAAESDSSVDPAPVPWDDKGWVGFAISEDDSTAASSVVKKTSTSKSSTMAKTESFDHGSFDHGHTTIVMCAQAVKQWVGRGVAPPRPRHGHNLSITQ